MLICEPGVDHQRAEDEGTAAAAAAASESTVPKSFSLQSAAVVTPVKRGMDKNLFVRLAEIVKKRIPFADVFKEDESQPSERHHDDRGYKSDSQARVTERGSCKLSPAVCLSAVDLCFTADVFF